jgi:hypothetical protein
MTYAKATVLVLLFATPAWGQPPTIKELSPSPVVAPSPLTPIPVEINKYRWFSIGGYTGPVTWQVVGKSVGTKETDKALTLFGVVSGQTDPGEYPVPADALIVWGKAGGLTAVSAWGVIDGKAKQLLALSFIVGPAPPGPGPDPQPPQPVTSFRVIFVKESGQILNAQQSSIPGAKAIRDYLARKTTPEGGLQGWREYDPQVNVTNEQPNMKALWQAVQPKITTVPNVVIQTNGVAEIFPFPADTAACLALLESKGGK